ncbi:sensor histidine kinase [Brevundimonas sp.]|jgi:signal transduction histidine kinase|uniref:sensor histidine kinase n=1 Tax=Brevundimonas sp. TaxID=1871086 RepID=UPI0037BE6A45
MDDGTDLNPSGFEKSVFSRWPAPASVKRVAASALPGWAHEEVRAVSLWPRLGGGQVIGVAAMATVAAGLIAAILHDDPTVWLWLALAGLSVTLLVGRWRAHARDRGEAAWRDALFERSGISLWREDWSAVGQAILALKRDGVHDIEAYFAARPEAARALRRQVQVKDVNSFTVEMMGGRSKADFVGSLDRILPDSDQTFAQWLIAFGRGDAFYRSETHIVRPDGTHLDCLFTAALPTDRAGFRDILVTALDITDYKALQARLISAETDAARALRISTLGALSASIAHEVNTPLASILANAQASLRWLRRPAPNLDEAERAIERAVADATRTHEIVARTRDFLSGATPSLQPVDLAETARIATTLIDGELRRHDVSVHLDASPGLTRVLADPVQMQQVLVNLLINGVQAMAGRPAPRDLSVKIWRDEAMLHISVSDCGPGVAVEDRGRLFDPFFSTGKGGMGMGLAICRSCVESWEGRIWLDDNDGPGATFRISLPAIED